MTKKATVEGLEKKIDMVSKTVDTLAMSVKRGFDETAKRVDMDARFDETATKQDIADIRRDIARVENIPIAGLQRRLERVEDDMRVVKTKVRIA